MGPSWVKNGKKDYFHTSHLTFSPFFPKREVFKSHSLLVHKATKSSIVNIGADLVVKFLALKNPRGKPLNPQDIFLITHSVSSYWSILALIIII